MKPGFIRIALAGVFGLMTAAAIAAPQQIPMSQQQRDSLGITVAAPQPVTAFFGQTLPAQVVVPPTQLRVVSAPQSGLISRLMVAAGDKVRAGQTLARIQSPELASLQREYLQALTKLRLASSELERDKTLFNEGIIAKRRYLETKSRHEELTASLEENRQALMLAGMSSQDIKELRNSRRLSTALNVRSPINGVVLDRQAETGQRVDMSAPLFRVADLEPLWIEVRAPLESVSKLKTGDLFRVAGIAAEGRLVAIGKAVDPASQTVRLRAEVTKGASLLKPGQYVEVAIGKGGATGAGRYRVPASAIARSGAQAVVFVQTAKGFRPQPVTVVESTNESAVITGDLSTKDRVAVKGIAAIKGAWIGLGGGD